MADLRAIKRRLRALLTERGRRREAERRRLEASAATVLDRFATPVVRQPHKLPAQLIVSLTSYPARFPTLARTLASLLQQSIAADAVILWVAPTDFERLPADVLALREQGLAIRPAEDTRSFKKIVPVLGERPDSFVVTADDDTFYPADWLQLFVAGWREESPAVLYQRGHRIAFAADGAALPYMRWKPARDASSRDIPTTDVVPTGVGGILYPPRSLHPDVTRADLFLDLCPHADDLWLFWMARRQGTRHRRVGDDPPFLTWEGSQADSLFSRNKAGDNDRQFAALLQRFGPVWR